MVHSRGYENNGRPHGADTSLLNHARIHAAGNHRGRRVRRRSLGDTGGIPIDGAQLDGYDRFFVVCTRPRGYVKNEVKRPQALRQLFRRRPNVAEAAIARPAKYNAPRELLRDLESDGKAYVFYPRVMPVTNKERNVTKLRQAYALGMAQVNAELPQWRDFLGV